MIINRRYLSRTAKVKQGQEIFTKYQSKLEWESICSPLISMSLRKLSLEAVVQRCSVKNVFLEISQNSQENRCARVSFLIKKNLINKIIKKEEALSHLFSCEFC